ncbi:MAG: lyase domain protein repeat-containing protein [Candidatus Solibacter sp.]|nr:lyase domain protein repeat-containing protein [Candidatus Solibacter sp.]
MRFYFAAFLLAFAAHAQSLRPKDVREIGKQGSGAIPRLTELLKDPGTDIRLEAVKQLTDLRALDALILATRDNDPEVQIRATDGLVNFYLPGYVQTGTIASIKRVGGSIKSRFTDTNDQVIDPFVTVRPDVVTAVGALARGGANMESRANAARAVGILRGRQAIPDLLEALRSKDTDVLYESLVALQKIRDESAGPKIAFLLRDLNSKVQIAAIETTGLLKNREAVPDLIEVMKRAKDAKVRRAALGSLAMLPDEKTRPVFQQYLADKDDKMRAAAAEGFARLRNPADLPTVEQAWKAEGKGSPRVSMAFALVMLGRTEISEFSPLQSLINNLNSAAYKGEAVPFLTELARDQAVRQSLYSALGNATKDEKIGIARVLSVSGDKASVPYLEKLSRDPDTEVAQEGLRALRNLQARL